MIGIKNSLNVYENTLLRGKLTDNILQLTVHVAATTWSVSILIENTLLKRPKYDIIYYYKIKKGQKMESEMVFFLVMVVNLLIHLVIPKFFKELTWI